MGYVKNDAGAGMFIRNGEKKLYYGNEKIPPGMFVQEKNNGGGEVLRSLSVENYFYQIAMVTLDKVCAIKYSDETAYIRLGIVTDSGIELGVEIEEYATEDYGIFAMDGGKKLVYYCISDSGYSFVHVYSISGTTLTLISDLGDLIAFVGPDYFGCFKISDTQLIIWSTGYSGGNKTVLRVITTSGSTVTVSAQFLLWPGDDLEAFNYTQVLAGAEISDGKVAIVECAGFGSAPYTRTLIHLLNLDGDTLFLVSSKYIGESPTRFPSGMHKLADGVGVVMATYYLETMRIGTIRLSGDTLSYSELDTGKAYYGNLNVSGYKYGYELSVNYPYIYIMCGNQTFDVMKYKISGDSVDFISDIYSLVSEYILTYQLGGTKFRDGVPVVPVGATTQTGALWASYLDIAVIKNINRYEVKASETKIDGVSITSLNSDKEGKIWMLKGAK